MTIVNVDAKSLEVVCAAHLSQDQVLMQELLRGDDIHGLNQVAFGLPAGKEGRLVAKVLKFRILYGGTEYSFAQDPDFTSVSSNKKYWKEVIDKYYGKYTGLREWHIRLMQEATTTGRILAPTGRVYSYQPDSNGNWPRSTILNYIVQGLGADLMAIIRVAFYKRLKRSSILALPISTVHDSIVVDCPNEFVVEVAKLYQEAFDEAPRLFKEWFGKEFNLPLRAEISAGPNMSDLSEITGI